MYELWLVFEKISVLLLRCMFNCVSVFMKIWKVN